ncbi:transketolase [Desulfolutivibrio sulfoxidireducens]|uniref:transketolase n=1 Tax=Desulfolutivibrio sulfoxidireducens TaxID=2773299 RepID=UPI00159EB0E0|nr:transketolase [Desulfolutivibrio sulfoxidireducens]QLA16955.1 transketolase [Desulfolutivibrio sulfoxidireducens]QLA20522.1 transketolase [Desulfolutivibrio sulfoxidireducens]
MPSVTDLDHQAVNVIKGLIMDATRKANSGHPGGAMSSADLGYVLFREFLNSDPDDTTWFNRDRFVLSAGHESMLLYALLVFQGVLPLEDLARFRQLGSRTPGHPENFLTPGVEATTGPLGQGFAMAVGMAVAEAMLRARLGQDIVNHYTYALASDGDIQTPVCLGAAALAGHFELSRLIVCYDNNKVQLAGPTSRCDRTDHKKVFEGLGWRVLEIDGHDHARIRAALAEAKTDAGKPTLIIGHTTIAKGSCSMENNCDSHGSPFSEQEITKTKGCLGLPADTSFFLPPEALEHFRVRHASLRQAKKDWLDSLSKRLDADGDFKSLWRQSLCAPSKRTFTWPEFEPGASVATRKAWGAALAALIDQMPLFVGGSADLDPSNQTAKFRDATGIFSPDNPAGRTLCFGVREFPMGALINGIALHGGLVPFGATFLVFSDYERNALRMSALQRLPVLHVFTHDSFYVGEDGPTHQPIEHASSLRLIPNMLVMRPADARETCLCVDTALKQDSRPTCLLLTRQGLPVLDAARFPGVSEGVARGGYILTDAPDGNPDGILLASGSEVSLALAARALLPEFKLRVVSMPCMELFDEQPKAYREAVLPPAVARRFAVEAGRPELWCKYTGSLDRVLGISRFGASAPAGLLAAEYGFTPDKLAKLVHRAFGGKE